LNLKGTLRGAQRSATLLRAEQKRRDLLARRLLTTGARLGCPPLMLVGLAGGAHPDGDFASSSRLDSVNHASTMSGAHDTSGNDGSSAQPPLILTVRSGSLAACEFLLLNGADVRQNGQPLIKHSGGCCLVI
uniref:ANK_REP_REGION domain-containing protein n=1 Tax=Echinostoma caproni TaxID=27848 RepID=A0A183ACQ4_9TREM